jgi:hypothetical protein
MRTLTFKSYRFYFFPQNPELLYQVVGTARLGVVATMWRRGYAGRPYMINSETTLLTEEARYSMKELGYRHVEPRSEAGVLADCILGRQHWYVTGPRSGTA